MRRVARIVVLPALAFLCWSAPAAAAPVDLTSAHTGLRAYRAYASSTLAKVGAARKSDDAFIAAVAAKCPNVLANLNNLPGDQVNQTVLTQFGKEVGADLVVSAFVAYRKVLATLTRRVSKLHWSSAASGRRIKRALRAQRVAFELLPSDLCADASALGASNGQSLPPATSAFLNVFEHDASAAGLGPFKATLKRYRSPGDKKLARTITRLENKADTALENSVNDKVLDLLTALGLKV